MQRFTQQKDLGNQQFKNKNYQKALQIFLKTSDQIEKIQSKQFLIPTTQIGKLYVILLINAAFACINIKKKQFYQKAIQMTSKALSVDSKNVKALFRRGIAMKQCAESLQRQHGSNYEGLIELYTKAKQDFQQVNLLEKSNQLALQKFKQTIKDIYRVTKAQGQQINLSSKSTKEQISQSSIHQKIAKSNPYEGAIKKKGIDMEKIMQQYKVNQVSSLIHKKVNDKYLNDALPTTRSQLQKGIRQISKFPETFLRFIYRFDNEYITKIQPNFDTLSELIKIILKYGLGEQGKRSIQILRSSKSFNLYWKSLVKSEKQEFKKKWIELGLDQDKLQ